MPLVAIAENEIVAGDAPASEEEIESRSEEESDEESDEESEEPGLFDHLPHDGISMEEYVSGMELPGITTLEVVCIMLDWMTTNKIHDTGAEDIWRRLRLFLPTVAMPTFEEARNLVKKHKAMRIQRIEICKNDCIA